MIDLLCVSRSHVSAALSVPSSVLAVVDYGGGVGIPEVAGPVIAVPLPSLNEESPIELWRSSVPVKTGRRDGMHYAVNGEALFGACALEEPAGTRFDHLTEEVYENILLLIQEQGYPYLLRTWNYYGDIGETQGELGRYQLFCIGRHRAFARLYGGVDSGYPAATVIGTRQPGVSVHFLAARTPGLPVENPRQVSAFRYPPEYGPVSPSFSRAMAKTWGRQAHFYVSGTASIVGHATAHAHDADRQLEEILSNLRALRGQAQSASGKPFASAGAYYKVYLREREAFARTCARLRDALGAEASVIYLLGDPCRRDLCVELEALYVRQEDL